MNHSDELIRNGRNRRRRTVTPLTTIRQPMGGFKHLAGPSVLGAAETAWGQDLTGRDSIEAWAPVLLQGIDGLHGANRATANKLTAENERFLAIRARQRRHKPRRDFSAAGAAVRLGGSSGPARAAPIGVPGYGARNRRWAVGNLLDVAVLLGVELDVAALLGDPISSTPPKKSSRPLTTRRGAAGARLRRRRSAGVIPLGRGGTRTCRRFPS